MYLYVSTEAQVNVFERFGDNLTCLDNVFCKQFEIRGRLHLLY